MVILAHSYLTFILYPRLYYLLPTQFCMKVRYLFRKKLIDL